MARDVRYVLRQLRRTPAFTVAALVTLALAIGANTAVFTVVDELLLRPLAYHDADRLTVIDATRQYEGAARPAHVSWPLDAASRWQGSLHAFADVTFYASTVFELAGPNGVELVQGASVAPSFFSTLDGPFVAGRPIDAANASTPSIVVSDRLARRVFGDPASAIGKPLRLNSTEFVVVGVADPRWDVPSATSDIWEPLPFARLRNPRCCAVRLLGRLRHGVTMEQAAVDVTDTSRVLAAADAAGFRGVRTSVTTLRNAQLGDARTAVQLLWAAVAVLLIVASANVVNLLVGRNIARAREMSIRQALGASRARLVAQGLTESALLAGGGVAGGVLIAELGTAAVSRLDPATLPRLHGLHIDVRICLLAAGLGLVTAVATGLVPALQAARGAPPRALMNAATVRRRRLLQALCVTQICAAVVLVTAAILFGRSLAALLGTDLGVSADHVVTASIDTAFERPHTADEVAATMLRIVEQVRRIPGVQSAGAGTSLPPDTSRLAMSLKRKADEVDYMASAVSCTPGYFEALGIRLQKGRFFTDADDARHPPVVILSATTARHLFGTDDPIGRTLGIPKFRFQRVVGTDATVIGIVADVKYSGVDAAAGDQVYWSMPQAPWLSTFLAVRTAGDIDIASQLRLAVSSIDPTVAVSSIAPLDDILAVATAPAWFRTAGVVTFALIGLGIAAVGLYGLVAYSVSQRTTELGVRAALGADGRDIVLLVLREGAWIAALGLATGVPAAYIGSRMFSSLLFGVKPGDAFTYAASTAALAVVALLATYPAARRAARVDPLIALRSE